MNILVTAGNTQVPIDRVRCLTSNFTGRTGASIALAACARGHQVTLMTSHPETVHQPAQHWSEAIAWRDRGTLACFQTFDELHDMMATRIPSAAFDAIVHAAAVADYRVAGVYAPAPGWSFNEERAVFCGSSTDPALLDRSAGKVKSDEPELWLRLAPTPKLIDRIRSDWNFRGQLVKFKLEVGVDDQQLLKIAEASRRHSQADWIVANTLEAAREWAFLGPFDDGYHKISRQELPAQLLTVLETSWRTSSSV